MIVNCDLHSLHLLCHSVTCFVSILIRCAQNLSSASNRLPLLTAQLQIITTANEQRATSSAETQTTVKMLVAGARNLHDAITSLLLAAEAAAVKVSVIVFVCLLFIVCMANPSCLAP